jgi:transcription antitermination factor NusG
MAQAKMMRWIVVHSQTQAEVTALRHLTNQGFHCFLPRRVLQLRSYARKTWLVLILLFSHYLFIRLDLNATRWRAIDLLANGRHPLPVPHGVVDTLLTKCDSRNAISITAMGALTKRLRVRIKSGTFSGQMREVTRIFAEGRDRMRVLLTLSGVETELRLPSYAIEPA